MNSRLSYVNLVGVLALVALCVAQWQRDRRLNLTVRQLDQVRQQQAAKLDEQAVTLTGLNADLAQFKTSFTNEAALHLQAEHRLQSVTDTNRQLTRERDHLQVAITSWTNAVAQRDEYLQKANARIEQLAAELNASIRKYNELVTNYNAVVQAAGTAHAQP